MVYRAASFFLVQILAAKFANPDFFGELQCFFKILTRTLLSNGFECVVFRFIVTGYCQKKRESTNTITSQTKGGKTD